MEKRIMKLTKIVKENGYEKTCFTNNKVLVQDDYYCGCLFVEDEEIIFMPHTNTCGDNETVYDLDLYELMVELGVKVITPNEWNEKD